METADTQVDRLKKDVAMCRTAIAILRTLLREARDDAKQSLFLVAELSARVRALEQGHADDTPLS